MYNQPMPYLAILGRQPAISLAELISLYPSKVQSLNSEAALISAEIVDFDRLGGSVKLAKVIEILPGTKISVIITGLAKTVPNHIHGSKVTIGLSLYGFKITSKSAFAASLELKKLLKQAGLSIRVVPGLQLDAAQIQHNHLISKGADIVIVASANATYIGITKQVQDIERYAQRDHGRPCRDPKVGMLPPKLAQIMINLANPHPGAVVLDPFCGTGVILQEALLMGYPTYGSDIEPELVDMTKRNLAWLTSKFGVLPKHILEMGNATSLHWDQPIGAVVTEGYLGPAMSSAPSSEQVKSLASDSRALTLAFLTNLATQTQPGTPVCITLPAWRTGQKFHRLNIIDQIEPLGYTLKQLLPASQSDLLYARSNQIVGRELITLMRK